MLWAPGVPADQADGLVADVARLAGVDPAGLVGPRAQRVGQRLILHWDRYHQGALVVGDRVAVVQDGGTIGGIWAQLTPVAQRLKPVGDQVVFPVPPKGAPVLATQVQEGTHTVFLDAAGEELHRYENRRAWTVDVTLEERTIGDPIIQAPARHVRVRSEAEYWPTDDDGFWEGGTPVDVVLNGDFLAVRDDGANIVVTAPEVLEEPWVLHGGDDVPLAANTVLHNVHLTWDWLEGVWPSHPLLSEQISANVRSSEGTCNAWYDGSGITFLREDPRRCHDFGRIADVVHHELGHAIHHRILATGSFASDVSEGSSDYVSATIQEDSQVGINAYPDGGFVRDIGPDRRYPDHYIGEVHNDGLIWASFLWNLRADWGDLSEDGVAEVDLLFLRTLEQGPTLLDLYEAVLLADDDDGDLSTGTPHDCDLMLRMNDHGIGPGPIGVIQFDHTPLQAQSSAAEGYDVRFLLEEYTPECGDLDRDSVRVWYTVDEDAAPGVEPGPSEDGDSPDTGDSPEVDTADLDSGAPDVDTGSEPDPYAGWSELHPEDEDGEWVTVIPRQPANSNVRYFIEAASSDGTQIVQTHEGRADGVWDFWVGDRRTIWCDGFEEDPIEWSHGPGLPGAEDVEEGWVSEWVFERPTGSTWGPDSTWDGDRIAVTGLDADYTNNNLQHLTSPAVDLSDVGPMLLLSYRRWLTVEDAIYDIATVWAAGHPIWRNPATRSGQAHTLDDAWVTHDIVLDERVSGLEEVQFNWTLRTDAGLEFGGWAIDDVCVVTLDDLPGHYTVSDLNASDDLDVVEVRWTQPWVQPLVGTILVRSVGAPPDGPWDGEELEVDNAPTPGEAKVVVDADVEPGVVYYYAVFTEGPSLGDLWEDATLGANLDSGVVPLPGDTGEPEDTGREEGPVYSGINEDTGREDGDPVAPDSQDDGAGSGGLSPYTPDGAKAGCGCAALPEEGQRWAGLVWMLLGLGLRRRVARQPLRGKARV